MKLDHINLTVENLDKSLEWYEKLFGFETVEQYVRDNGKRFAVLQADDVLLCITEYPGRKSAEDNPSDEEYAFIYHFGLRIENPEDWKDKVNEYKVPLRFGGPIRYPHSTSWYIRDPSGHEIEVVHWDHNKIRFPA